MNKLLLVFAAFAFPQAASTEEKEYIGSYKKTDKLHVFMPCSPGMLFHVTLSESAEKAISKYRYRLRSDQFF
jgi:hypothetical protein